MPLNDMKQSSYLGKHANLVRVPCCPECHGEIRYEHLVSVDNIPAEGSIVCGECKTVGRVSCFKHLFGAAVPTQYSGAAMDLSGRASIDELVIQPSDFSPSNNWSESGNYRYSQQQGDRLRFRSDALSVALRLLKHPAAGIALIKIDGKRVAEIDLYQPEGELISWNPVFLGGGRHSVEVENSGRKNEKSSMGQVWIVGVDKLVIDAKQEPEISYVSRNEGNPYPVIFDKMLAELPDNALVLDCGSGDRCFADQRVINFEFCQFRSPDVFGDGHKLPFKDNSFDFVLSQAVIEHVYDPFQAAREIFRVLKPGGRVYCESAFMQPLHAVPYHYFNTTVWGIELLFRDFDRIQTGSEGNIGDTLTWMYKLTKLREKGHGEKVDKVLSLVRELDWVITREELRQFSSFVTFLGIKPVATSTISIGGPDNRNS